MQFRALGSARTIAASRIRRRQRPALCAGKADQRARFEHPQARGFQIGVLGDCLGNQGVEGGIAELFPPGAILGGGRGFQFGK